MIVYLDACCLSRLTDNHSQIRIRQEAEAVERVLAGVRRERIELLARVEAQTTLSFAVKKIAIDDAIAVRAQNLVALGYGPFDALHLAAAESGGADVLLTTDDRLLKRAARKLGNPRIPVRKPVSWIREQGL